VNFARDNRRTTLIITLGAIILIVALWNSIILEIIKLQAACRSFTIKTGTIAAYLCALPIPMDLGLIEVVKAKDGRGMIKGLAGFQEKWKVITGITLYALLLLAIGGIIEIGIRYLLVREPYWSLTILVFTWAAGIGLMMVRLGYNIQQNETLLFLLLLGTSIAWVEFLVFDFTTLLIPWSKLTISKANSL